jgi:DNA (cytosine-5)-methyltransferase 1
VIVGSTFSGVGGLDLGLERAGMKVAWQAEVDEWSRRVLSWHWPEATVYDDVRSVNDEAKRVDLLAGGFPCQDLSVAGKRAGLAGERSGLFFEFARIADELRPRWLLVENVVGLLSSSQGRDFGIVLATLAELGYGLSWRVVDARYFGVPQRRRRVFIVGCLGDDGERAVRALGAGGEGDLAAGECSWQVASLGVGVGADGSRGERVAGGVAPTVTAKWAKGSGGPAGSECGNLVADSAVRWPADVAPTLNTAFGTKMGLEDQHALGGAGHFVPGRVLPALTTGTGARLGHNRDEQIVTMEDQAKCLTTGNQRMDPETETYVMEQRAVSFAQYQRGELRESEVAPTIGVGAGKPGEGYAAVRETCSPQGSLPIANALQASGPPGTRKDDFAFAASETRVRRLTPVECERLMSWPDDWTAVDGDKTAHTRRYAACGNGVVSNVAEWIGRRILAVDREAASDA